MSFSETEAAYASGLFEGEGSVYSVNYYYTKGEKRARKTPQLKVQMAMTDKEPLEKFASIFGGRIHGPYSPSRYGHPGHCKDIWQYMLDSKEGTRTALKAMYPHLSPRRQAQINLAIGGESH